MKNIRNKITYIKIFLLFFAFYFVLTRSSTVPLIYPDEAGYIGWAYKMLYGSGSGLRYLPGYSVLLVPVFAVFKSITAAFPVITALNSLIAAIFAVCIFRLAEAFGLENRKIITLAVCLYPAVGLYANFAMCESLLSLCFILLVLAVFRLEGNINRVSCWIAPILLAGFLCLTHSRTVAILPAFMLCIFPDVLKKGKKWIKLLYFGVLAIGAISAGGLVLYLFLNTETVNAAHLAGQIAGLLSMDGLMRFTGTLFSQFSYLVLSTFGFIVIGIYYTVKMIKTHRAAALFMLLSFVFSAVLSAVFMYHHENPAHILYGRYTEYTIYGILLIGFSGFLKDGMKKYHIAAAVLPCLVTAFFYAGQLNGIDLNMIHTWGIYSYRLLFYNFSYASVMVMFAALAAIIFLAARRNPKAGIAVLCGIFAISTVFAQYDYFCKGALPRKETPQLAYLLEDETEIYINASSGDSMVYPWEYFNYTVYNPYLAESETADLILSSEELDYTLLGVEKHSHLMLYSKTADESKAVDTSGMPEAEIAVSTENEKIILDIKNTGRPWLCRDAADELTKAVRAGLRVYKDGKLIDDLRYDFQNNIYSSVSAEFDFSYPDGEYIVVAETVREFIYRGGEEAFVLNKKNGKITLSETDFSKEESFSEFDPLSVPGNSGFYRYYVTESGAEISGVQLEGEVLAIETYGEHSGLDVDVFADGAKLEFIKYDSGSYYYRLGKTAASIRIESETYSLNDNFLTFLTTESNFKPTDLFVRGMKKVFGIRLDHRRYGVDIQKIKILKEEVL